MVAKPTIIVVDDAPEVRLLLKTQLRLSGRLEVVAEGEDGNQAVELAGAHRPTLMLLDVSMPGLDGLAALPLVLDASPTTRVVMFSGFEGAGLEDHTRSLGASAFIEKAIPMDELVERLVSIASSGTSAPSLRGREDGDPGQLDPVLEDHLERFRQIFDDAAIGMATITLDGRVVRANRHLRELLDEDSDSLVGLPYADLVREGAHVRRALDKVRGGAGAVQIEHGLVDEDPSRRLQVTISAVIDAQDRPLYFFLQVQDVTGQRAAEEELRLTEQRFRLLVEAVQDYAIFMLDPDGHVASWNAGAQRSKGYTADEIVGRHFRTFYPREQQLARHPEHELDIATREGSYAEEGWRVRKDGSRFWAHVTITAVLDEVGTLVGFAKVTRDSTERRRMLELQEEAAAALATANRSLELANSQLQAVADDQAEFLAVTAHELRSPVGVLAGSADLMAQHHAELSEEERGELAGAMSRNAVQLRRLLDDLLTASRAQARTLDLRLTPLSLEDHLAAVVSAARKAWADAVIDLVVEPGLTVRADAGRLTQMVENLLANARQHGESPVTVTAHARGDAVHVCVRDSGHGVPADVLPRLFERFGKTTGGTGLGLYIVRELARAHGGDASYRPDDQTFYLRLPADEETA